MHSTQANISLRLLNFLSIQANIGFRLFYFSVSSGTSLSDFISSVWGDIKNNFLVTYFLTIATLLFFLSAWTNVSIRLYFSLPEQTSMSHFISHCLSKHQYQTLLSCYLSKHQCLTIFLLPEQTSVSDVAFLLPEQSSVSDLLYTAWAIVSVRLFYLIQHSSYILWECIFCRLLVIFLSPN